MVKQANKPLQFFKYFDAALYSNKLHIPSAYSLYAKGNLPDRGSLKDKYGNIWPVELAKVGNEGYFQEGWGKVVQDSCIEHGDFLVFQYDGDRTFYFKIIGRNSCDKEGVGCLKFKLGEKRRDQEHVEAAAAAASQEKKRVSSDHYGFSIFRLQMHAQPKNPYFVTKIRPKKPKDLYVPNEIIKAFKLNLPPKIVLRDPLGRTWPAKLTAWNDGRAFYNGGWERLCKANFIDEEDKCVCEFLPGQNQGEPILEIQIHRCQNDLLQDK